MNSFIKEPTVTLLLLSFWEQTPQYLKPGSAPASQLRQESKFSLGSGDISLFSSIVFYWTELMHDIY